jgi:quaternary ammonium compound-resistance protein SugE
MAWIFLLIAGLLEIVWAFAMKQFIGFTHLGYSGDDRGDDRSVVLLSLSTQTPPPGTAYTVWAGIGAIGAFVVGIAVLDEAATVQRIVAAALIIAGLVLMNHRLHRPCPGTVSCASSAG